MSKGRIIALCLVIGLITTTLQGFVGAATTTAKVPATKSYQNLRVFLNQGNAINNEGEAFQKVNSLLGGSTINLTVVPGAAYTERLMISLASADLPDIFFNTGGNLVLRKNATARFTETEYKTYMPEHYALMLKQAKDSKFPVSSIMKMYTEAGKLSGVFAGNLNNALPFGTIILRKDILDEFKMKVPKTLTEWEAFFKAFKAKYPTKYPMSARGKDAPIANMRMIFAAHGVLMDRWFLVNNKLEYGPFSPKVKDALAIAQRWFKAGYINPEYLTMDNTTYTNEFANGNMPFMYMSTGIGNQLNVPYSVGSPMDRAAKKDPGARFVFAPQPTAIKGVKAAMTTFPAFMSQALVFGRHLDKDRDKLYAAMKVVNKLATNQEIYELSQYGIEGKHFTMVSGVPQMKQEFASTDANIKAGIGWQISLAAGGLNNEFYYKYIDPRVTTNIKNNIKAPIGVYSNRTTNYAYDKVTGPLLTDSGEDLAIRGKVKQDEFMRMFNQVIVGEKTPDDYMKFIAEWKKEIGNEMTTVANKLYLQQWLK